MNALRWLPLLLAMLIMLYGELPRARGQSLILTAGITSGPSPGAVSSDLTSAAGLAATFTAPSLQEEAYFVTSDANWWVDEEHIQYHAVGGTYGSPGSGQSKTATLTPPASTTTNLVFSGSPGYWRVPCILSVCYADNLGHSWSDYATVYVEFIVVNVNIAVWNDTAEDWDDEAEIAAGCIDSPAHRTDVMITVSPAVAAKVSVHMTGGTGHADDEDPNITNNAVLSFAESEGLEGVEIDPDSTNPVFTGTDGARIGALLSSNIYTKDGSGNPTTNVAISSAGSSPATVYFGWDNYDGDDQWVMDSEYIWPGESCNVWLYLGHDYKPINGHAIRFFVEQVDYIDGNGSPQTLVNTPTDPHDLSDWAYFDPEGTTTDEDGWAHVTIHYGNHPEATWVGFKVYDWIIYDQ
jgi:hypothetical protein